MQDANAQYGGANQNQNVVYEGLAVRNRKAPLLSRVFAYFTDIAIVTCIMYLLGVIFLVVFAAGGIGMIAALESISSDVAKEVGAIVYIVILILAVLIFISIYSGYFVYNEYKHGTTLGKKIFGLRVISVDGGKLSIGQCILRDLMRLIDCQLILPGFLSIQLTADGKRLGDMVAGTLVVHSRAKEREAEFTYVNPDTYNYFYQQLQPKPVSIEDSKLYLNYAFCEFISPQRVAEDVVQYARQLAVNNLTVPAELNLTNYDLELFFAEYCHQTIIDAKGS